MSAAPANPVEADVARPGVGIKVESLACRRGDRLLFANLSFALAPGEALLLTGPNGSGKTSLLRALAGLLHTEAGEVIYEGTMALLDERHALDTDRPLRKALAYWAGLYRQPGHAIDNAMERTGIAALADIPVGLLSSGQKRRAGLARMLLSGAHLWLLDEPGNALDADGLAMLASVIADHRASCGMVIVATHQPLDLPKAKALSLGQAGLPDTAA